MAGTKKMKVKDLIKRLKKEDQEKEVRYYKGYKHMFYIIRWRKKWKKEKNV